MRNIGIYLTYARPGQGKSSDTARTIASLFREYARTEKKYPHLPRRELWCNLKLSEAIERRQLKRDPSTGEIVNPDGHLCYWDNPKQLRDLKDCDIVIDEVANYFPADGWANLPRWLRKTFAQHRHRGLRMFANTQDYMAVDINFRRMVTTAYNVKKLVSSRDISATQPPPSFIFAIVAKRRFDPAQIEQEGVNSGKLQDLSFIPSFFLITRTLVEMYDTRQDIPEYMPDTLEHEEKYCYHEGCNKVHVTHRVA